MYWRKAKIVAELADSTATAADDQVELRFMIVRMESAAL
jgi:hypothetical protein